MIKRAALVGCLLLAMAAGALGYRFLWPGAAGESVDARDAGSSPRSTSAELPPTVVALGRIQPAGGMIELGGMAGDRVARILVNEGDPVEAHQELVRLDSFPLREAERDLAAAQLAEAEELERRELAHADRLLAEARLAVPSAKLVQLDFDAQGANIELLKANAALAHDDLQRLEGLKAKDAALVAAQDLAHQQMLVKKADAELTAAEQLLARSRAAAAEADAQAQAKLASLVASRERIPSSLRLDSLRKGLALAAAKLELSRLKAPRAGRILKLHANEGEAIGPTPLLLLADTSEMTVVAEVYEDRAFRIRPGQRATVKSNALPQTLAGTVERVGALVAGHAVRSLDPSASSDRRVVEAVVRLDAASAPIAARLIHLQVDVTIDVGGSGPTVEVAKHSDGPSGAAP